MAKSRKKQPRISFLSYLFIGVLVTGITVGVILVQEGPASFSFARSPFGIFIEPDNFLPQITNVPSDSEVPISPAVTRIGQCGWCGNSCVSGEMLRRLRCADLDRNPNFSCRAMVENGQTVCRVISQSAE